MPTAYIVFCFISLSSILLVSAILEKIQLYIGILKTEDCSDDCEGKKKKIHRQRAPQAPWVLTKSLLVQLIEVIASW